MHLANGNPSKLSFNGNGVGLEKSEPTMPKGLSKYQQKAWKEIIARLSQTKVITKVDDLALREYCAICEEIEDIKKTISDEGYTVVNGRGGTSAHPLLATLERFRKLKKSYLESYGLTGASRSRVEPVDNSKEYFDVNQLLSKRKQRQQLAENSRTD